MKKTTTLVSSLILSSALLSTMAINAEELIVKTPLDLPGYCHMQFPEMRSDTLSWDRPVLDEGSGKIVDFYGSCAHDPTGGDAVKAQSRVMMRGFYGDGE
ncbi:MAG TPA: hypothetical protein VHM64_24715 [Candidatus Binatia bacterium]|nr:hypothetical protein [Candidatus Binatia bacterium]